MLRPKFEDTTSQTEEFIPNCEPIMTSIPSLRLIYFPVRARAEAARMIMAYGGIACKEEDCNSFFGMSFPEAKKAGKLPFGQLPVLEVAGKLIGELLTKCP